jgi:hypothetical protein
VCCGSAVAVLRPLRSWCNLSLCCVRWAATTGGKRRAHQQLQIGAIGWGVEDLMRAQAADPVRYDRVPPVLAAHPLFSQLHSNLPAPQGRHLRRDGMCTKTTVISLLIRAGVCLLTALELSRSIVLTTGHNLIRCRSCRANTSSCNCRALRPARIPWQAPLESSYRSYS